MSLVCSLGKITPFCLFFRPGLIPSHVNPVRCKTDVEADLEDLTESVLCSPAGRKTPHRSLRICNYSATALQERRKSWDGSTC
ncbi:hypothetical protein FKM82_015075 [Ascaphus truei]